MDIGRGRGGGKRGGGTRTIPLIHKKTLKSFLHCLLSGRSQRIIVVSGEQRTYLDYSSKYSIPILVTRL